MAGFGLAVFALVAMPAQYTPVLWRHDRSFVALGIAPLVVGGVIAAAWNRSAAVASTLLGVLALMAGATVGYRLYGGIGWPNPFDLLVLLSVAGAAVGAMAFIAGRGLKLLRPVVALALSISSIVAFSVVASNPGNPDGPANQCETRGGVKYCAFPGFSPFVDRWEAAVAGVLRRVPADVRAGAPPVVQAVETPRRDALATPFLDWDRPHSGVAELALALDAAAWALGLNEQFQGRRGRGGASCNPGVDDGRNIVAFWLGGQSTAEAGDALRNLNSFGDAIVGSEYAAPIVPPAGAEQAVELLKRDPDEVGALVRKHWESITSGEASGSEVAEMLGLPAAQLRSEDPDQADPRFHTQDCV